MHRPTCPVMGCGREIHPSSVACPSHYRLVPQAVRVDLEACMRTSRAWTADPLWQLAYRAALRALALTIVERTDSGHTSAARRSRARRAALVRWRA